MTEPRTHRIRQINGLAGVTKAAMLNDTELGEDVTVTDDGQYVRLSLSASQFPALLTPTQARYIGNALLSAANRVSPHD